MYYKIHVKQKVMEKLLESWNLYALLPGLQGKYREEKEPVLTTVFYSNTTYFFGNISQASVLLYTCSNNLKQSHNFFFKIIKNIINRQHILYNCSCRCKWHESYIPHRPGYLWHIQGGYWKTCRISVKVVWVAKTAAFNKL